MAKVFAAIVLITVLIVPMSFSSIGSTALLDSLITPATLAARLGTTERSLSEWRITGRGPKFIRIGRSPRYRPEAV